jgi:hypothetical protein
VLDACERGPFVDGEEYEAEEAWAESVTEVMVCITYGVELDVIGGTLLAAVGHVKSRADRGCNLGTGAVERGP